MATMYDYLFTLTEDGVIRQVQSSPSGQYLPMWQDSAGWIGLAPENIPNTVWNHAAGSVIWNQIPFRFTQLHPTPDVNCLLLQRENMREALLEGTLDVIPDGIQIYDAAGTVQFFNRSTLDLLEYSSSRQVEGHNLLDIFAVDPEYSTTLAALHTHTAVVGRVDQYKSTTGKNLSTVNTGVPIFKDGVLLGCVSFERDMKLLQKNISNYQNVQNILLRHLPASMSSAQSTRYTLQDVIGSDPLLIAAKNLAAKMALKDMNILIQGETGTGKEIFAQGIHNLSSRKNEKFVAINCAAFPENLIEGLLFGTAKGAFTGSTDKMGLIEEANHGTLFLDELNSMSLSMQAKLLRVLQEKTLRRVGGTKNIPVDIRVLSSCNEDAYELSESGALRRDLFYRLASVVVEIPPLRERLDDIPQLTWHYIRKNQELCVQPITEISPDFWERLRAHRWPGNVRELFHVLSFALSDCEKTTLRAENLPARFHTRPEESVETLSFPSPSPSPVDKTYDFDRGFSQLVKEYERQLLRQAYLSCDRNATKAAELLKISRQNFQYYLKKYDLNQDGSDGA